jgi:crotonobetainyl-CoA:carnitine CoA-transferase CaiB-like acyl-CoA transferase
MNGPLDGLRVLDLTRVLAGPLCTQLLGDLGADVIKIERPGLGDEARHFAPPYLRDEKGEESGESAYFAGTNRNKRSLTVNLDDKAGQELVRRFLTGCDILVENFKTGTLVKRELGYEQLKNDFPRLIYCSVTGFGQTGPYAERPGYDSLIQAMGGIMSITGEPDGEPMKVSVPIADIMAGMYAAVAVLAAVRHLQVTGKGQFIDIGMLDTQVAWLSNQGMNYLATGRNPERLGNQHPNILPYQVVPTADSHIMVTIGNDAAFNRFCELSGCEHLLQDERFNTNAARVRHRALVTETLNRTFQSKPSAYWLQHLERMKIGCGPINTLEQVFADQHVSARKMVLEMDHPATGSAPIKLIANPIKLSETPVTYRRPPPMLGQHTEDVLQGELELTAEEISGLREKGVV